MLRPPPWVKERRLADEALVFLASRLAAIGAFVSSMPYPSRACAHRRKHIYVYIEAFIVGIRTKLSRGVQGAKFVNLTKAALIFFHATL